MSENQYDAIIIGSGLGGLLCGYILSREGMRVCIIEKNNQPGGALQTFKRKGIGFDTGIHYLGGLDEGQILDRYFKYFGLAGNLRLSRMNKDKYDIIAFDDTEYPLAQGFDNFVEQLLPYFPEEKGTLQSYTEILETISRSFSLYNLELPKGVHTEDIYRHQSAYDYYQSIFTRTENRELRTECRVPLSSILAGNNFLYAGNIEKTPLHVPALINHSFISSAWKTIGGSQQIADILIKSIKSFGGILRTGCEITEIHREGKRFTVTANSNEQFSCERLISGIHPAATIAMMDPSLFRTVYSSRILNLENTTGSFALYIVLKENTFNYFDYNFYFHKTKNVWYEHGKGGWPAGYMLYTPVYEETSNFAKSLVIMTYMDFKDVAPWEKSLTGQRDAGYNEFKKEKANQLISLAEKKFPGLRSKIAFMETSTPLTWRDYTGTPGGSMYGIQKDHHNPSGTSVFPRTKIPGLFFTGQNVNLHGALGVTIGSVMTCSEILGYEYLIKKIRNG
jgi:all-trans-retinol 13,14-reductase